MTNPAATKTGPAQLRDEARLAYFLRLVPEWMRLAVEFRHSSWHCEEVFALLEAHQAAYCVTSGAHLPRGTGSGNGTRPAGNINRAASI